MLGLLVAGAAALATAAIASSKPKQQRFIVGGVDLTDTNLSLPFWVDFSVGDQAPLKQKLGAFQRLQTAVSEFNRVYPHWLCQSDVSAPDGRFVLYVTPVVAPPQRPDLAFNP